MIDAELLIGMVFSGLAALTIDEIEDVGEVRACTRGGAVQCPTCGTHTRHVHAFHERVPADVAIDGRRVLIRVRVRRMRCHGGTAPGRRSANRSLVCWSVINAARCGCANNCAAS